LSRLKIKGLDKLTKIIAGLKAKGKKIVFTNGCFDLLHWGHVKYLEDAKSKGDILIVAINRDASVRRIKGTKRPIVKEKDRAGIVAALESVDYVVLFIEDTPLKVIKLLKPDILVKGADWNKINIVGADYVLSYGGRVSTIKLIQGRSTTGLIRKIAQSF
jgi:D-beta-D-heptose 7-phosphate kinase/D-beta-D-heptose 1-phosphate adenosyltransferase